MIRAIAKFSPDIELKELQKYFKQLKSEKKTESELKESRKKLTGSVHRIFKETFCPVCSMFACPYHTPGDPGEYVEDNFIKAFPYNPFILEEGFKRVQIETTDEITIPDEQTLFENKIFQNIITRLRLQKRESCLIPIKCKNLKQ